MNIFPNDASGAVANAGVPPLSGGVLDHLRKLGFEKIEWDRAQISVCYPGYPQPWEGVESPAAARYRRARDGAHVDGLARFGAERRRKLSETHGFILGAPLNNAPPGASPFVIWEGSHRIIRAALQKALEGVPPEEWPEQDITAAYQGARRYCFEHCARREIHVSPGGFYIAHRLALHGVAPWSDEGGDGAAQRMAAYFRPDMFEGCFKEWLESP